MAFICGLCEETRVWSDTFSHKLYNVGISAITKSINVVVEGILRTNGIIFVSYLFNAFLTPHATLLTIICYNVTLIVQLISSV